MNGAAIKESLENYFSKIKIYAAVSIISRLFFMVGLLLFFTSGLNFNTKKYILSAMIALGFLFQLYLLSRLWAKRLNALKNAIGGFN
jgi:hypothetical protein